MWILKNSKDHINKLHSWHLIAIMYILFVWRSYDFLLYILQFHTKNFSSDPQRLLEMLFFTNLQSNSWYFIIWATVGIPMVSTCAPLLSVLYSFEAGFVQKLLSNKRKTNNVLSINNRSFMTTYTLYTSLPWTRNQMRPLKLVHPLLISIYYILCLMGPFQPIVWQSWLLRFSYRQLTLHLQQYTKVFSLWCLYIATYKICQSLLFVWKFYICR